MLLSGQCVGLDERPRVVWVMSVTVRGSGRVEAKGTGRKVM